MHSKTRISELPHLEYTVGTLRATITNYLGMLPEAYIRYDSEAEEGPHPLVVLSLATKQPNDPILPYLA